MIATPEERHKRALSIADKFWNYVERGDGCWLWAGVRGEHGYGSLYASKMRPHYERAPRLSWMIARGPIPTGMLVCHRCDNPPCVKPDHLFLGTMKDNIQDAVAKGRIANGDRHGMRIYPERICRGEQVGTSKLTTLQVLEMRERYATESITIAALAHEYGITDGTARPLLSGETWKHIGGPLRLPKGEEKA